MSNVNVDKTTEVSSDKNNFREFIKDIREFAITVDEVCPEGHRKDPSSGRCLPLGSLDHTSFTRSLNVDQGPQWRGDESKPDNTVFAAEVALDADDMTELDSCVEGTTFSFIQRKCISIEEADLENMDGNAREEEDAAAPGQGGSQEIVNMQPEGRRDTVNHQCPTNEFFDYVLRKCIPLNKDTVLASENAEINEEFKKAVAFFGKVAKTSPDPLDAHTHLVTVNQDGDGMTSVEIGGLNDNYPHSHEVTGFDVTPHKEPKTDYISRHPGPVNPMEDANDQDEEITVPGLFNSMSDEKEEAAPIKTKQRNALPSSSFGVPRTRGFPLDTCGRVRNAMARFNQAKGLSAGEKATLRRKILAAAKKCGIKVVNFAKAMTDVEFAKVVEELMLDIKSIRLDMYRSEDATLQGPCPPGMLWTAGIKRCSQTRGFVDNLKREQAQHADIVKHQPEGRRDPVGFQCPEGWFFDFTNRRCLPLDPSQKPGTTTDKAEVEKSQRQLSPNPEGRPAQLPQDCPAGTIWDAKREVCIPLDSRKKIKSEEVATIPSQFLKNIKKNKKDDSGKHITKKDCGPDEFFNPILKKCVSKKDAFKKGKSKGETIENAQSSNREGLTPSPAGQVRHATDCPPNTAFDPNGRICRPIDSTQKNRPTGSTPQSPTSIASIADMSVAQLVQQLDIIIKEQNVVENKDKDKTIAKNLPNAAFPPSLISAVKRSLMHHSSSVQDPYNHATVEVGRLRNAIVRSTTVEGFSEQAILDARAHLLYHAHAIIEEYLSKKV